ncbi:type IV pilus assembly protein PilM [Cellulomonas sp. ATA003]|uniref:type IV pilus assembly protein PilM n=1 Tax=Cellulomonas sp. ATA003 TaxID=3073064 RepID=UPI0028734280|nr:type IV pilus assembly protein PilM [Cellulomonas sp. ATA003]WNB87384.1 type IV pilus assembly protein PilM [Cellulomonas sp. ATA003]
MPKVGVIGLDLGSTHVRAVEVRLGRGGAAGKGVPTLTRYAQVPLPLGAIRDGEVADGPAVTAALQELWVKGKFTSRDVNIGVGNQRVVVRELELPWMPLPQIRASLPFQVQELIPMPVEEALLDYYPTGEREGSGGRMMQGMLVAATRDTVRANLMAVESAGLRPRMVDLTPFALLRALTRDAYADQTVALVEIGARITQVVIVARGVPRFVRMLPSGGQNVTDAVAGALGIAAAEAEVVKRSVGIGYAVEADLAAAGEAISTVVRPLMEAVRNTFVYYASNNPGAGIEVAVLTGGGSQLPGLDRYLESTSRLTVVAGDPLAALKVAATAHLEDAVGHSPSLATPIGLAYGVAA